MDKPLEELTYEEAYAELEAIINALEAGQQALDESLRLFERGQVLLKHCTMLLDHADLKVRQLAGDNLIEFQDER